MCSHLADLKTAEDELAILRRRIATVATWIHNQAYDRSAREALARDLRLPEPSR